MDVLVFQRMCGGLSLAPGLLKTVPAVDRFFRSRLERNLGLDTGGAAGNVEHLTFMGKISGWPGATLPAFGPAVFAPRRFIAEIFLGVEFLFAGP